MPRRIILFELNEVPWKIVDDYVADHAGSALAGVVERATCFTSMAADRGHLSPWTTWPTLHRGVNDEMHMIASFGQDHEAADAAYPPIWTLLLQADVSVGILRDLALVPGAGRPGVLRLLPAGRFRHRAGRRSGGARDVPAVQPHDVPGIGSQCRHQRAPQGGTSGSEEGTCTRDPATDVRRSRRPAGRRAPALVEEQPAPHSAGRARVRPVHEAAAAQRDGVQLVLHQPCRFGNAPLLGRVPSG
jgi:hypothetical protein